MLLAQTTTTLTTTTTTVPSNPGLDINGAGAAWFVGLFVAVIVSVWAVMLMVDRRRIYKTESERIAVIEKLRDMPKDQFTDETLQSFLAALGCDDDPDANPGGSITAALLALLTVTLVAFALGVVLLSSAGDAIDLRKTIVTSLLSILGTIAGFYFGARTAQTSADDPATGTTSETTSRARRRRLL